MASAVEDTTRCCTIQASHHARLQFHLLSCHLTRLHFRKRALSIEKRGWISDEIPPYDRTITATTPNHRSTVEASFKQLLSKPLALKALVKPVSFWTEVLTPLISGPHWLRSWAFQSLTLVRSRASDSRRKPRNLKDMRRSW